MANDLAKKKRTTFDDFILRLGSRISNYTQVADIINPPGPTHEVSDVHGVTTFTAQVASPTAQDLDSNKSVTAIAAFEKLLTITEKDERDNPGLLSELAMQMADAAAWTIADLWWTTVKALDTTVHPGNADPYTATGGGDAFFVDDFTLPVAQINLLTAALSPSTLSTARQKITEYKNKAGLPAGIDMTPSNLRLVVPPALETTARDIVGQPGQIYDGTGLVSGSFQGIQPVTMPEATDNDDWFLFHRDLSPVKMWIRKQPQLRITLAEASGNWLLYGSLEAASVLMPWEGGVVMSKV